MQPLGDMTFDHVITWWIKKLYYNFHEDTITKRGWNTYASNMISLLCDKWFIIIRFLNSYMLLLYVMWSRNLLKLLSATFKKIITTKQSENVYKNKRVAYLHLTWVNQAKVINATAAKIALMKGTNLKDNVDFDYMISWQMERASSNFKKAVRHQIW